ncbi:MAG: nucleoside triphosphate pyrophosphohydrolase [Tenuifilaceae bacterium]|jgi:XTP/dITP diphosphohydrolase|uniref:nucleoside triphosphate pyrophosphohydrolase n=1 Tax=Perlabentimonas gracilis TaxID=2715279 RepID=UPI001409F464|nr:nucleoside triphosphate pyrophosphohydrolase [Perlabentimonas gracilis]MDX9770094.1 nucleoside triphosphate pyrophosphohydrolase [Tenuifilaceae bacterium]NHB68107.1 nucleoside triphosphate pyrophosphohydrolase [Perlabentimonas gracilis]
MKKPDEAFLRLLNIMEELREKCPWDKEQTFETLRNLTIEETYELADAILENDLENVKKELGDLLLHIVFYSKIASETNTFDITDVINQLCDKLVYRHPHVFGTTEVNDSDEVVKNWEQIKMSEKQGNKTVLSGVPKSLSALIKANRIQEKVRAVGFDWEERHQVWDKVSEEFEEVKREIEKDDSNRIEAEFGDLLFSVVNAARLYNIDPETALERTNKKFIKRFGYLESKTIKEGRSLKTMTLDEMNEIWEQAKAFDKP